MSTTTLPAATPHTGEPRPTAEAAPAPAADARFPRPRPDPQDDWPKDVRLPDEWEDGEC